jgi:hypothetical protein
VTVLAECVELDVICKTHTAFALHTTAFRQIRPYCEIKDGDLPPRKELNRFLCAARHEWRSII